ncbi:hypothetical protein BVX98_05380 [bacterium F11]|nr:hypothetical protein BVX98_05380 [bacterium F11]
MEKDTSKPKIHAATTYKLYVFFCICLSSGLIIMLKFPEMHSLGPEIDPLSFKVYGLPVKGWKIIHLISSLVVVFLTVLHIYFNRDWIKKVGEKKLNLNVVIGLLLGIAIILFGLFAPSG